MASVALCCGMAFADEVTLNVADATNPTGGQMNDQKLKEDGTLQEAQNYKPLGGLTIGSFNFTFSKAEGSSEPALYYNKIEGDETPAPATLRVYKKNTMTMTAPAGVEMTQVVVTIKSAQTKGAFTVNTGEIAKADDNKSWTWTGSANSIEFTVGPDANLQIVTFDVTYGSSTMETVEMPVFTPASGTGFDSELAVSIACATEGATIYYTTDGTAPTEQSSVYSAPIVLTEGATVKAFATKAGMNASGIATAEYTKNVSLQTLQELIIEGLDDEETEFTYSGQAVVTYQNGSNLYVRDNSAALLIYGKDLPAYTPGDVLTGFKGTFKNYYETWELMANASSFGEPIGTDNADPKEMTIATITPNDQNAYIILKGVDIADGKVSQGGDSLELYDKFHVELPAEATDQDLTCIISYYQAKGADAPAIQIYPISMTAATGIEGIAADEAATEVYSINGVRVNPASLNAGVYVVIKGGKAHKVIVK